MPARKKAPEAMRPPGLSDALRPLLSDHLNSRMNSPSFGQIVSRQRRPEKMP